jgi:hypothetical protein
MCLVPCLGLGLACHLQSSAAIFWIQQKSTGTESGSIVEALGAVHAARVGLGGVWLLRSPPRDPELLALLLFRLFACPAPLIPAWRQFVECVWLSPAALLHSFTRCDLRMREDVAFSHDDCLHALGVLSAVRVVRDKLVRAIAARFVSVRLVPGPATSNVGGCAAVSLVIQISSHHRPLSVGKSAALFRLTHAARANHRLSPPGLRLLF